MLMTSEIMVIIALVALCRRERDKESLCRRGARP